MLKFLNGLIMAFTMYTIVPMPYKKWEEKNFPYILVSLPFIGLFIGLLWYVISLMLFDLKKEIVYVIVMFFPLALTGFIHIDGYMDTCDAIFSRAPLEKKKQILKDPRVGAFAVIGLVFLFFIFYSSLSEILKKDISYLKTFIFIPVFSRCMTVLFIIKTKAMSDEGFIASFKKNLSNKHFFIVIFILFFAITLSYFIGGKLLLKTAGINIFISIFVWRYCIRQMYGISGDLCGFIITLSSVLTLTIVSLI